MRKKISVFIVTMSLFIVGEWLIAANNNAYVSSDGTNATIKLDKSHKSDVATLDDAKPDEKPKRSLTVILTLTDKEKLKDGPKKYTDPAGPSWDFASPSATTNQNSHTFKINEISIGKGFGSFSPCIYGTVEEIIKQPTGRFAVKKKIPTWDFNGTVEYKVLCTNKTENSSSKTDWIPASKMSDVFKNCDKTKIIATISTPVTGKRFTDLFNDLEPLLPVYPPYPGEEVDSKKKAWGLFSSGYQVKYSSGGQRGCPVCKSSLAFSDTLRCDVNITECDISLPKWINLGQANQEAQEMWNNYIAQLLKHEEAHLEDFNNHFLKVIYPQKALIKACAKCDEAGYRKLLKDWPKKFEEIKIEYKKFVVNQYELYQKGTKRVETEYKITFPDEHYPLD